jgi:hypothetical protein
MKDYSVKLAFFIILAYGLLYLLYFWQTPLGQMPVLDGSENFLLANQISSNSLPSEPFFRSMLYPALLSIPCSLGFSDNLFTIASFSGILFHFLSSLLIFLIVNNLWNNKKAAIISSLLYGLYPPAVFFAAEPLDTTVSILFMLGSLYCFFIAIDNKDKRLFAASGIIMGISGLFRSNLLPFAIIYITYPITQILYNKKDINDAKNSSDNDSSQKSILEKESKDICKNSLLAVTSFLLMIILGGVICYAHSGEFKLMPWQGASNLYSANSLNANGKYYKHSVYIPKRKAGTNPARAEAEYIYSKETGQKPPFNINEFNKFWLKKCFDEISSNPSHWINLTLKKIYYLFNNYEQYNNKTFGFHKSITPILKYNPLCFGYLIIIFFLTLFNLFKDKNDLIHQQEKSKLITLFTGIFFLSLGIIAFYVSARFRIPITSLIIIFSSYLFCLNTDKIFNKNTVFVFIAAAFITFSNFCNAADISTYKEDRLLIAFACSRLGLDDEQILWANRVIEEDPHNLQAIRLKIVAFTNLALLGNLTDSKEWNSTTNELQYLNKNNLYFDDTILLSGCYTWKFEKNKEKARLLWIDGGANSVQPELFQACLIYTELLEPDETDIKLSEYNSLLSAAINKQTNTENNPEIEKAKKALGFLLD